MDLSYHRGYHLPRGPGGGGGWRRVRGLGTLAGWAFTLWIFLRFFEAFSMVLLGFLAAFALASALRPLVRKTPGRRAPLAVVYGLLPVLVLAAIIALIAGLLREPIEEQVRRMPQVERNIDELLRGWSERLELKEDLTARELLTQGFETIANGGGGRAVSMMSRVAGAIVGLGLAFAFFFFGSMYLLIERPGTLLEPVLRLVPSARRLPFKQAMHDLAHGLRWWVLGTLISMAVVGAATWLGFRLIGLEMAAPLGLMAGMSEVVPTFGPLAAFSVAVLFAATQGPEMALWAAGLYVVVQVLEGYVLLPVVMKRAVDMPPVVTLFSVVLWGKIFGLPGLLLAIPINLLIWVFVNNLVLRRRQPLTPAEQDLREK